MSIKAKETEHTTLRSAKHTGKESASRSLSSIPRKPKCISPAKFAMKQPPRGIRQDV